MGILDHYRKIHNPEDVCAPEREISIETDVITLVDLQVLFILLGGGLFLATIVFCIEWLYHQVTCRNQSENKVLR